MSIHNTPLQVRREQFPYVAGVDDSHGDHVCNCDEATAESIVEVMNAAALLTQPDINNQAAWIHWKLGHSDISPEGSIEFRKDTIKVREVNK